MWPSGSVRQNSYPVPLHDGVSLTHDYREFAHAQGGVTLGPEKGEVDAEFLKFDVDVKKWLQTLHATLPYPFHPVQPVSQHNYVSSRAILRPFGVSALGGLQSLCSRTSLKLWPQLRQK
jgi:hypothetical protein